MFSNELATDYTTKIRFPARADISLWDRRWGPVISTIQ
jgi:hypothetical protein